MWVSAWVGITYANLVLVPGVLPPRPVRISSVALAFLPVHFLVFGAIAAVAGMKRWSASTQWFAAALEGPAAAGFYTIGVTMMLSQPVGLGEVVLFTVAGAACLGVLVWVESMAREADANRTHAQGKT